MSNPVTQPAQTAPAQPQPTYQDDQSATLTNARTAARPAQPAPSPEQRLPAAIVIQRFLVQKGIRLKPVVAEAGVGFVGDGFVITDKSLIKLNAEYVD